MWRILMPKYVFCSECVFYFDVSSHRKSEICRAPANYEQVRTYLKMETRLTTTPAQRNKNNKCKDFRQCKQKVR